MGWSRWLSVDGQEWIGNRSGINLAHEGDQGHSLAATECHDSGFGLFPIGNEEPDRGFSHKVGAWRNQIRCMKEKSGSSLEGGLQLAWTWLAHRAIRKLLLDEESNSLIESWQRHVENVRVCTWLGTRMGVHMRKSEREGKRKTLCMWECCIHVYSLKYFYELRSWGLSEVLRKRKEAGTW